MNLLVVRLLCPLSWKKFIQNLLNADYAYLATNAQYGKNKTFESRYNLL